MRLRKGPGHGAPRIPGQKPQRKPNHGYLCSTRSRILGKIALPGGLAIAASVSYEQHVGIMGERFSHIVAARAGYPVTGTPDALSTMFFVGRIAYRAGLPSSGLPTDAAP